MSLDLSKLENVRKAAHGKTMARCPACAAAGGDAKGDHLVLYEDGKYGCVACPDDHAHRKEIYARAGKAGAVGVAAKLSVQTYNAPPPRVIMDLGRFERFNEGRSQQTPTPAPVTADVEPPVRHCAPLAKLHVDEWDDVIDTEILQEA